MVKDQAMKKEARTEDSIKRETTLQETEKTGEERMEKKTEEGEEAKKQEEMRTKGPAKMEEDPVKVVSTLMTNNLAKHVLNVEAYHTFPKIVFVIHIIMR